MKIWIWTYLIFMYSCPPNGNPVYATPQLSVFEPYQRAGGSTSLTTKTSKRRIGFSQVTPHRNVFRRRSAAACVQAWCLRVPLVTSVSTLRTLFMKSSGARSPGERRPTELCFGQKGTGQLRRRTDQRRPD